MELADKSPALTRPAPILLVTDDTRLAGTLASAFPAPDWELKHSGSGREGLVTVLGRKFDLIVLEQDLPGKKGFEVLAELRREPSVRDIPIFFLTATPEAADRARALELGAADCLSKPVDLVELGARLRTLLHHRRGQEQFVRLQEEMAMARTAAEAGTRTKTEFLATVSHEIRTPMNGVVAMTDLLMRTELKPEQRDYVETIRSSSDALLRIINDILNYSKLEAGKIELEQKPFQPRACLEEAVDLAAARAAEKKLELTCQWDALTPHQLVGDVTRVTQILINLINNAVKFTEKGEVAVEVKSRLVDADGHAACEVHFAVRDTGIGIPANKMGRLFRSFSQVDSSITRRFGGTGLGLAISRGLAELMGGKVWAESTVGQGSTFHFAATFPLLQTVRETAPARPPAALVGRRVLIVDDHATNRQVLARQVESWGMTSRAADCGKQALEWLQQGDYFDLAVLDMQMPDMDGLTLAGEIRKLPAGQTLPLMLLTSVSVRPDDISGAGRVFSSCLTKPVKEVQLQASLVEMLAGPKGDESRTHVTASTVFDTKLARRLPLRVLLIDDNLVNQKVALKLLKQMGYAADIANNGQEAIEAVECRPYDLLLMDVQMPVMDGLEATRRLRLRQKETDRHPHFMGPLYIVAMTANVMQGDREKCLAVGMDDYLPKPVRPDALRTVLEHFGGLIQQAAPGPRPAVRKAVVQAVVEAAAPPVAASPAAEVLPAGIIALNPPVDFDRLRDFAADDPAQFQEIVDLWMKQTTAQLEKIQTACQQRSAAEVSRVAHSCAGASATCGMVSIIPPLRQLEHQAKEGDLSAAESLCRTIVGEFERIKKYLASQPAVPVACRPVQKAI